MFDIACEDIDHDELRDQLLYVTSSFKVPKERIHDVPRSGKAVVLIQPQDGTHVQGDESLVDFVHPDECCYWFGATNKHLELNGVEPVAKLFIPHELTWTLYASQAVAITLYDRYVKRGGFG